MASRKLTLKRERLVELSTADLGSVVGGRDSIVCVKVTQLCPTSDCTGYYPSINAPCTGE